MGGRAARVVGKPSAAKASVTIRMSVISLMSFSFLTCHAFRERKTHQHKHFGGIVPGLGGWQILFMSVLGSLLMEKT